MAEPLVFTPMKIQKKTLASEGKNAYLVYKSRDEFVTVEATTASQALQESGVQRPYRIVRRQVERLMDHDAMVESGEFVESCKLTMEPLAAIEAHNEAIPAANREASKDASGESASSPSLEAPKELASAEAKLNKPISEASRAAAAADAASGSDWEDELIDAEEHKEQEAMQQEFKASEPSQEVTDLEEVEDDDPLSADEVDELLGNKKDI